MDEQNLSPIIPEAGSIPRGELVQNFSSRRELDAAMAQITGAGLPAQAFFVVGHDVKQVEYFVGKLSYPRVALSSAFSGAIFGALIGLVTAIFTQTEVIPHLVMSIPLGIAIWMISGVLSFSRSNKSGAFQMRSQSIPSAFSLMGTGHAAAAARQVLGSPQQPSQDFQQQAPAHPAPEAPQQRPSDPTSFVGPAYNKDGSPAGGKFGLRIDDPEEYARAVRTEPAPQDPSERIEQVREEQSQHRYGKQADEREVAESIRQAPAYEPVSERLPKKFGESTPTERTQETETTSGSHRAEETGESPRHMKNPRQD